MNGHRPNTGTPVSSGERSRHQCELGTDFRTSIAKRQSQAAQANGRSGVVPQRTIVRLGLCRNRCRGSGGFQASGRFPNR